MFKISQGRSYKTLRSGDDDFMFSPDGITMVPRASFEIDDNCLDIGIDIFMKLVE